MVCNAYPRQLADMFYIFQRLITISAEAECNQFDYVRFLRERTKCICVSGFDSVICIAFAATSPFTWANCTKRSPLSFLTPSANLPTGAPRRFLH